MADEILERIERRMEQFDATVQWAMERVAELTAHNEAAVAGMTDEIRDELRDQRDQLKANTDGILTVLDRLPGP